MFPPKLRVIAFVVLCGVGFVSAPVTRAVDQKSTSTKPPKKPAVVRLVDGIDAAEATKVLGKLFSTKTVIVPLPDESALLVYATEEELKEMQDALRVPCEGQKEAAKTFDLRFKKAAWDDVLDWYAKVSGLTLVANVKPTGSFTFMPPEGRRYTLAEITDFINEALAAQKFILIRHEKTFLLHPADERIDPTNIPWVELKDLPKRGRTELVEMQIPLKTLNAAEVKEEIVKLLSPLGVVTFARGKVLIARDTAGNIARIAQILEAVNAPKLKPMAPPVKPLSSSEKTYTFRMKDAKWDEVLDWYSKVSGLTLITTVKPAQGTFTFTPAKADQRFTIAEITDIINDVLTAQHFILIRRSKTFFLHPADEKLDLTFFPRISIEELPNRGRTELVQVIFLVEEDINDVVETVKKMTGQFGSVIPHKNRLLIVQDTAENVANIKKLLDKLNANKRK